MSIPNINTVSIRDLGRRQDSLAYRAPAVYHGGGEQMVQGHKVIEVEKVLQQNKGTNFIP